MHPGVTYLIGHLDTRRSIAHCGCNFLTKGCMGFCGNWKRAHSFLGLAREYFIYWEMGYEPTATYMATVPTHLQGTAVQMKIKIN